MERLSASRIRTGISSPAELWTEHLLLRRYRADDAGQLYDCLGKDLVESCPETAKAGETVTVTTLDVTDGDKEITVSGVEGTEVNGFEYQFVMPDHDVEVSIRFIGNGLA